MQSLGFVQIMLVHISDISEVVSSLYKKTCIGRSMQFMSDGFLLKLMFSFI